MMTRPTLFLHFHLAEAAYTDDNIAEVKRSYSHIGPSTIDMRTDEAESPVRGSILTVDARARGPFWDKSDPEAEANWNGVMTQSLKNMFTRISAAMTGLNGVHNEHRRNGIYFAWLELDFHDNPHVMLHLNEDSSIEKDAYPFVVRARDLCNEGIWGDDVRTIYVPSPEVFNAQEDEAQALLLARTEAEAAAKAEAEAAAEEAKAALEESDAEDAEDAADAAEAGGGEGEGAVAGDDMAEAGPADGEEAEEAEEIEEPFVDTAAPVAFDIDFTVWGIAGADGAIRPYAVENL